MKLLNISRFFIIVLFSSIYCQAGGIKTLERTTGSTFAQAVREYEETRGSVPHSWGELTGEEACRRWMEVIHGNVPDFTTRYRFIPKGVNIAKDPGGRVLAMGDGPLMPSKMDSPSKPPERMFLVRLEGEKVEFAIFVYPETMLESLLRKSGYSLADFTGPNGKWEPEPELTQHPGVETDKASIPSADKTISPVVPESPESHREKPWKPWALCAGIAALLAVSGIWVVKRRKRFSHDFE